MGRPCIGGRRMGGGPASIEKVSGLHAITPMWLGAKRKSNDDASSQRIGARRGGAAKRSEAAAKRKPFLS